MLAVTAVAAIAIDEMLATQQMPREGGVRLSTDVDLGRNGGQQDPALVMDFALAPCDGDAVLAQAPVFVEADAAPALAQKLLDAEVSTERVQFTLRPK